MKNPILRAISTISVIAAGITVVSAHPNHPPAPVLQITTDITWSEHIRPIFRQKCMICHNPAGIVRPEFSMSTYRSTDVASGAGDWIRSIEEEILTKRMPPWGADPRYNSFANHRFLTEDEIRMIVEWVRGGRPEGTQKGLPTPPEFLERGWSLAEPDLVFEMPEPHILPIGVAESEVSYKFPVNFQEDRQWITGVEFFPGNPALVHTMMAFIHDPVSDSSYTIDMEVAKEYDPLADMTTLTEIRARPFPLGTRFLGQWVRGDLPVSFPEKVGRLLRTGSTLELKIVYRRNVYDTDQQARDRSKFAIHFATENLARISESLIIENEQFVIPAGEPNHEVRASATLSEPAYLYGAYPHLGLLGKDLELLAHYPDGRSVTLLLVPDFRYGFNQSYIFSSPLFAPAGTRLELIAHYDNSPENWGNPNDPPKDVKAPIDERLLVYIDYYTAHRIYVPPAEPTKEDNVEEASTSPFSPQVAQGDSQERAQLPKLKP